MHLRAKRPIFVPAAYFDEIEKLSKAALMDLAWDFARRCNGADEDDDAETIEAIRMTWQTIKRYRDAATD